MSRHSREDLDARIRRAWPVDVTDVEASPHEADRLRALIDDRLATDAEPGAHEPPRDRHDVGAARRRIAAAIAGVVLVAGAVGVGTLVASRSQRPAAELAGDPTAEVQSAIATTRQAETELSVTHEMKLWSPVDGGPTELEALVEHSDPVVTTTTVVAADGDWSHELRQLVPGADDGVEVATAGMRYVDGHWYERPPTSRRWERIVADEGEGPTEPPVTLLDGPLAVELLERYDGGWVVRRDGPSGLTAYDAADADAAYELAVGISSRKIPGDDVNTTYGASITTATARLWIDDETGRIHRLHLDERTGVNASEGGSPYAEQQTVTFHYGDPSPIEVPDPVTDLPLEDWCARNVGSCR
jgi:hypothetical protein